MSFCPQPGATVYNIDGTSLLLDKEIGKGGEGSVWSIQGDQRFAAKFYHNGMPENRARKLEVMCRLKSEVLLRTAAWPTSTLKTNRSGPPEGLLMPRITGYKAAHLLYSPKSRRVNFPEAQFPFIVHSAMNIARAFCAIHDAGQVIGDVNHGNLLVSDQATVTLIDCDSFEISDQATVYPCLVGVPPYTPPELQGKSFTGTRRTPQHDAFGLAVLIFHLLFLGRHPFAGIYRQGTSDMTVEQAISEYRFAYSPDRSFTRMEQPPSAPRLADFPPEISQLFMRAFSPSGADGTRGSAREWTMALQGLSKTLRPCNTDQSHHFSNHLATCPWCRVEHAAGIPMFGFGTSANGRDQFDLSALWAQIELIVPSPETRSIPSSQMFAGKLKADNRIPGIVQRRRIKRATSVAVVLVAIGIVFLAQPTLVFSLIVLAIGLVSMTKLWKSGHTEEVEFIRSHEAAQRAYQANVEQWNQIKTVPLSFAEFRKEFAAARDIFNGLPAMRARRIAQLNDDRRQKQLKRFLESHRIEDATLPNIGKGRKDLLRVFNVEDAFDIEPWKIADIKGFGPAMRSTLLAWRAMLEQQFRFDPSQGVDPNDIKALELELSQKRAETTRHLKSGPQTLKNVLNAWTVHRDGAMRQLNQSAERLGQAEVNMKALARW